MGAIERDPGLVEKIRGCLVGLLRPSKIIIFGSYARGEARPGSDIDIAAIAGEGQPHDLDTQILGSQALRRALKGKNLAFDFILESKDTFERERQRAGSFEHTIDSEGIVIFEQPGDLPAAPGWDDAAPKGREVW